MNTNTSRGHLTLNPRDFIPYEKREQIGAGNYIFVYFIVATIFMQDEAVRWKYLSLNARNLLCFNFYQSSTFFI